MKILLYSILLIVCTSGSSFAKFYTHPQEIFSIEYPDTWIESESRFPDGFVIRSENGEGIEKCSFRADEAKETKGKNSINLINNLLKGDEFINTIRQGIPSAELLSKERITLLNSAKAFSAVYSYDLNYLGQTIKMGGVTVIAPNMHTGHSVTVSCSTTLERLRDQPIAIELLEMVSSLVIIEKDIPQQVISKNPEVQELLSKYTPEEIKTELDRRKALRDEGLPMIGIILSIVSVWAIRKFGTLGLISQRFRSGNASPKELDEAVAYIKKQPDWIISNPELCGTIGNVAPITLIIGIILMLIGI